MDEEVPSLTDRYLIVEGRVAASRFPHLRGALPEVWSKTTVCCFLAYANADYPLGSVFDHIWSRADPHRTSRTPCHVVAVTQEFAKPFAEIPRGWKTICLLDFPAGIPDLIQSLPAVTGWHEAPLETAVSIGTEESWMAALGSMF